MASSSSAQESNVQVIAQQAEGQQERATYELKGVIMSFKEWELKIQTENPVDFESLAYHGCDIKGNYETQGLMNYFNMLNGPTYKTLIRHLWVRASVYDKEAFEQEEKEKVLIDPSLAGKTREEMGLEPFKDTEIRYSLMGIPVYISEDIIAYVVTPQFPDLKISLNKSIYQNTSQRSVTFSTIKSLNKINISLSFAKYSIIAAEIIIKSSQKVLALGHHNVS